MLKHKLITVAAVALGLCLMVQAQDKEGEWANYRYAEDNARIEKSVQEGGKRPYAVLMGDSIFDGWDDDHTFDSFFSDNRIVDRGIGGQCTSHMVVRFQDDVVNLKPKYVAILGGTNDVAHNAGFSNVEHTMQNIKSMCEIAKANGLKVILFTTPPFDNAWWNMGLGDLTANRKELNALIRSYAKSHKYQLIDLETKLAGENGITSAEYSGDRIHPNTSGYKVMAEALLKALKIK